MNNQLIQDIKQQRFLLDQYKAKRSDILKNLNAINKEIKQQENKIYTLVGMLEKSYHEVKE